MAENRKKGFSDYDLEEEYKPRKMVVKGTDKCNDTSDLKAIITKVIGGHMFDFEYDMNLIKDPKERCDIMLKLMQFVLPKVSALDVNGAIEVDTVSDEISRLAQQTAVNIVSSGKKKGKEVSS